jgi:hypothetical protein
MSGGFVRYVEFEKNGLHGEVYLQLFREHVCFVNQAKKHRTL